MQKLADSVCIRCGKTRVILREWKDKGTEGKESVVIHVEAVCPDKECQSIVDAKFNEMRERRSASEDKRKSVVLKKAQDKLAKA